MPRHKKPVAEIKRNEETGQMEIVHSEPGEVYFSVPDSWNFSRFLKSVIELEENDGMVSAMVRQLRESLMEALPDFGRHLGYDGKSINSYSTGHKSKKTGETSDTDADWGKHKTRGIDSKTGKQWTKIKTWFGYGLHLIADTLYEIPVAVHVTPASHSEHTELRSMIKEIFEETPQLGERCDDFAATAVWIPVKQKRSFWTAMGFVPPSISVNYGRMKRMNRDTILQNRSHDLFILTVQIPLCILRKGQSIAFVQQQENSGTWFIVALKKVAIP